MAVALKENRIVRGVEAVAERPDGVRTPFVPFPTPVRDDKGQLIGAVNMLVDVTERKQAETQQHMLLSELNHRIKNNLQMLHGLLRTAERESNSAEAKAVLQDASQRVGAIAAAQRLLYSTDSPHSFDAEEFLTSVCNSARLSFSKGISVEILPVKGRLSNDASMPLALILNELLTNAAKHGLKEGKGKIGVALHQVGDELHLTVSDDGPGFKHDARQERRSSGLGLVTGLARQIGGSFRIECESGTRCTVTFPKQSAGL
jgi:two-component sensor histidine kinase